MKKGRELWRTIRFLVGLSFRADPLRTLVVLIVTPLQNVGAALTGLWLKIIVDAALAGDAQKATWSSLALATSVGANHLLTVVIAKLRIGLEDRTGLLLDQRLMELTSGVPGIEHHERPEYLDRLEQLRYRRWLLRRSLSSIVGGLGVSARAVGTAALLATVHPAMLLLPLFAIPTVLVGIRLEKLSETVRKKIAEPNRLANRLFRHMTSATSGAEIRIFGLQEELLTRHGSLWAKAEEALRGAEIKESVWSTAAWIVFATGYVGAMALAVVSAASGTATPGQVLLTVTTAGQINTSVAGVVTQIRTLLAQITSAGHYFWLADYAEASKPRPGLSSCPSNISRGLEIRGLSFQYPGTDKTVLSGINLRIPPGTTLAFVGENGAGKTTLVKLLCRFYEPTEGSIEVDGFDISSFDCTEWRDRIAVSFQDFCRFEFTAREAVGVGDLHRMDEDDAIQGALTRAGATDVQSDLPSGMATQLGKSWENGVDLSGGQWQKLALARGLMAAHPFLQIFDEPTASLDAQTEHALFERFARAANEAIETGTITVLVSHRFSTVRMADLIVVLENGEIAEVGSHEELIHAKGVYCELFGIQARSYK